MPVLERLFFAVAGIAILAGLIASYGIADRRQMSAAVAMLMASPRSSAAESDPCHPVVSVQHLLSPLPATLWFGRDHTRRCGAGETTTSGGNRMMVHDVSLSGMPDSRP
jgi:hypothetical protein